MMGKKLLLAALAIGAFLALTPFAAMAGPAPSRSFQDEGCTHPVALMLSQWMQGVTCEDLAALHDEGVGFGVIAKAYVLGKAFAEGDWENLIALHREDVGWGQIAKAYVLAGPLGRTAEDLLTEAETTGWGQILKEYRDQYGHGKPPWAAQGKPPWAGPPEPEASDE
jgi:hypothetical protein